MPSARSGSIHLFRLAGVDLYLHWSWFLVAFYEIQMRNGRYSSLLWSVLEYLALFAIVLMHEFGHAMACRSVGGRADTILLWPFGGVAYVSPPQRPGATLWSIAAGPLVNVALMPVLYGAMVFTQSMGWPYTNPNAYELVRMILFIDVALLVFNILPIYPLDGGQILRSLLWFGVGRARSLMAATVVGLFGIVALAGYAVWSRSLWTGAICVFLVLNCWNALQQARALGRLARLPRRPEYLCPSCRTAPPIGAFWKCQRCRQSFDAFATRTVCPNCGEPHPTTICVDCREESPIQSWLADVNAGMNTTSSSFSAR